MRGLHLVYLLLLRSTTLFRYIRDKTTRFISNLLVHYWACLPVRFQKLGDFYQLLSGDFCPTKCLLSKEPRQLGSTRAGKPIHRCQCPSRAFVVSQNACLSAGKSRSSVVQKGILPEPKMEALLKGYLLSTGHLPNSAALSGHAPAAE